MSWIHCIGEIYLSQDGDVDRMVTGKEQDKISEEPDAADKCSSGSKSV